jgi:hypothetical protein
VTENGTETQEHRPQRMTQGEIIRTLLEKGGTQTSSVQLSRNARGAAQFEVVVRTDPDHGIPTVQDASRIAQEVYDDLAKKYPGGEAE